MPLCPYGFLPRLMLCWVSPCCPCSNPRPLPVTATVCEVLESGFHLGNCSQHSSPQRGALPGEATRERCDSPKISLLDKMQGTWEHGPNMAKTNRGYFLSASISHILYGHTFPTILCCLSDCHKHLEVSQFHFLAGQLDWALEGLSQEHARGLLAIGTYVARR